jgi:aminoglycoside phosphotransferase (APT) family kinase protein
MHLLLIENPHGTLERLVLRRHVRADWLAEEPDLVDREAVALQLVAASPVVTPKLLAVDMNGQDAGVPALLMTALPGRLDWAPTDLGCRRLVWRLRAGR